MSLGKLKRYTFFDELQKDFENTSEIPPVFSPNNSAKNLFVFVGLSYMKDMNDTPRNVVTVGNVVAIDTENKALDIYVYNYNRSEQLVRCQSQETRMKVRFEDCTLFHNDSRALSVSSVLGYIFEIDDKDNIVSIF